MIDFSAISNSSAVGRLLRAPLRLVPPSMVVPIVQGPLRGARWVVGSSTHGCWLGSYEAAKQRQFVSAVRKGDVVYDIGAHVGFYSLLASRCAGESGRVIAAEPFPRNVALLQRHLDLNHIRNVTVVPSAIGMHEGEARFRPAHDSSMGSVALDGSLIVPMVSIDSLVVTRKFPAPNIMKIDVEGGEYDVLAGAQATLRDARPLVFLATHGPAVHARCCELLRRNGYALRAVGGTVDSSDELIAEFCR